MFSVRVEGLCSSRRLDEQVIKFLLIFPGEDGEFAGQTVAEMVHGRDGFAFRSFGSARELRIGLVCVQLSFSYRFHVDIPFLGFRPI